LPTINFPLTFYAICSGQSTNIALTPSIAGSVTPWTTGNSSLGLISGNSDDSLSTISQPLTNSTNNTSDTVTYSVRAIDASGGLRCSGAVKNIRVAVNPLPIMTSVTSKNICSKDRVNYAPSASTGAGATFTWALGTNTGGIIGGNANASPTALVSDSLVNPSSVNAGSLVYNITTKSSVGCNSATPASFVVNVAPLPVLTSPSTASLCSDSLFVYNPQSSVAVGTTTFFYDRTSNVPTIANEFQVPTTGISHVLSTDFSLGVKTVDYKFLLTSAAGCKLGDQHLTVTVNPTPDTPGISVFPLTRLCAGATSMNFSTSRRPDPSEFFKWSAVGGGTPNQKSDSSFSQNTLISFPSAGNATVSVQATVRGFACKSKISSKALAINSGAGLPNINVVFFSNNLVAQVAGAKAYQWGFDRRSDLDSTALIGENTQNYDTRRGFDPGLNFYWVMVTFADDCVQKAYFNSPSLAVPSTTALAVEMKAYPNPVQDMLTLELPKAGGGELVFEVYDLAGKRLLNAKSNTARTHIRVADLVPGYYMVTCTQDGIRIATSRFIKN
jgi:hypothetical protein